MKIDQPFRRVARSPTFVGPRSTEWSEDADSVAEYHEQIGFSRDSADPVAGIVK